MVEVHQELQIQMSGMYIHQRDLNGMTFGGRGFPGL